MSAKHAPKPWRVVMRSIDRNVYRVLAADDAEVADVVGKDTAKALVNAVNAHDALVQLAQEVAEHFRDTDAPLGARAITVLRLSEGGKS